MIPHTILFLLSLIGLFETGYLIRKKIAGEKPVCVIGHECHAVLESKYNKTFYIANEVLGFAFYGAVFLLTAFLVGGVAPFLLWDRILKIIIAASTVLSLYFTYLQWRVIRAWCFWCLVSAGTVFVMAIVVLISDLTF